MSTIFSSGDYERELANLKAQLKKDAAAQAAGQGAPTANSASSSPGSSKSRRCNEPKSSTETSESEPGLESKSLLSSLMESWLCLYYRCRLCGWLFPHSAPTPVKAVFFSNHDTTGLTAWRAYRISIPFHLCAFTPTKRTCFDWRSCSLRERNRIFLEIIQKSMSSGNNSLVGCPPPQKKKKNRGTNVRCPTVKLWLIQNILSEQRTRGVQVCCPSCAARGATNPRVGWALQRT